MLGREPRERGVDPVVRFSSVRQGIEQQASGILAAATITSCALALRERSSVFRARRYAMPRIQVDTREAPRKSPACCQTTIIVSLMTSSVICRSRVSRMRKRCRRRWYCAYRRRKASRSPTATRARSARSSAALDEGDSG